MWFLVHGVAVSFVTKVIYFEDFYLLSFQIIWGELYEKFQYGTNFSFELRIAKVFEVIK